MTDRWFMVVLYQAWSPHQTHHLLIYCLLPLRNLSAQGHTVWRLCENVGGISTHGLSLLEANALIRTILNHCKGSTFLCTLGYNWLNIPSHSLHSACPHRRRFPTTVLNKSFWITFPLLYLKKKVIRWKSVKKAVRSSANKMPGAIRLDGNVYGN